MAGANISLPEEKAKDLEAIVEKIVQNREAIEQLLDVIEKLKETGVLSAISALAEGFEEGFNSVVKPELMASIANAMMFLWLLGSLDHEMLFSLASRLPKAMEEARKEFELAKKQKPSILKLIRAFKNPQTFTLLKALAKVIQELAK